MTVSGAVGADDPQEFVAATVSTYVPGPTLPPMLRVATGIAAANAPLARTM